MCEVIMNYKSESEFLKNYDSSIFDKLSMTTDIVILSVSDEENSNYRKKSTKKMKIIHKNVELDVACGCVKYHGNQMDLTKNELKILTYLFQHKDEIVPRLKLVEYLWDSQVFIDDNTLSVNVTRLRHKLEKIGIYNMIETKHGMGYRV